MKSHKVEKNPRDIKFESWEDLEEKVYPLSDTYLNQLMEEANDPGVRE
jgi:hypothetical protein